MYRALATIAVFSGTVFLLRAIVAHRRRNPRGLPLPPGPKGLPFFGNALQTMKESHLWLGYQNLCKEYGDMVYLNMMGQGVLILGSGRRATELLETRSLHYSDRPNLVAWNELCPMDWNLGVGPYGPSLRRYRRALHEQFKPAANRKFHPVMCEERDIALRKLRDSPQDFAKHLQLMFGSIILRTVYGQSAVTKRDEFMHYADGVLAGTTELSKPGKYLVNVFPILRHIPPWFPGGSFHHAFKTLREKSQRALDVPFEQALKENEGRTHPSVATDMIDNMVNTDDPSLTGEVVEKMAKGVCVIAYVAGAAPTNSAAIGFLAILAKHPEIQRRAQAEIDEVVGPHRLPEFTDKEALPYVQALILELTRWYTVSPFGVPHCSAKDDEYDGYFIPKDTYIIPNLWAILHDPEVFENPFKFTPERHMANGELKPKAAEAVMSAFGHGRRICPGRFFSNDALFIFVTSFLATFDITPPKEELINGIPEPPTHLEVSNEGIAKLLPFKCDITVRPMREGLIM